MITRFDIFTRPATEDMDEREVVRFFEKRKLLGEIELEDVSRYDGEFDDEDFTNWIKGGERSLTDAMDYLGEEPVDEGDEEEGEGGNIVPAKYRIKYGVEQNCGDDVAKVLSNFVTLPRANKKDIDGGLDNSKLRAVADLNGLGDKLAEYEHRGLNGGLRRMNIGNILRGMVRRGERVEIGEKVWPAREVEAKPRKARKAK